jgi:hypothetical protein
MDEKESPNYGKSQCKYCAVSILKRRREALYKELWRNWRGHACCHGLR